MQPVKDFEVDPATPLLCWSSRDSWKLKDAFEGVFITGGTGSGKTSSSGASIAQAYLAAGFGGLVLCVKSDEAALWQKYCALHNRAHHVVKVDASKRHCFNFLDYELNKKSEIGAVDNAVNLLFEIVKFSNQNKNSLGSSDEYWMNAARQLLTYTVMMLNSAYGRVSVSDIMKAINSSSQDEFKNIQDEAKRKEKFDAWKAQSFSFQSFLKMATNPVKPLPQADVMAINDYFSKDFGNMDIKPRSSIISTLSTSLQMFLVGDFREMFASKTTFVPELCRQGIIIIMDLSIHRYGEFGRISQLAFKYIWQKAMQQTGTDDARPVFIWADEAQYIFAEDDIFFQSTCRSNKVSTVYLTQSISGFRHALGGINARDAVASILTNFQTKIFHQNSDPDTQNAAADFVGKALQKRYSSTETNNLGYASDGSPSTGVNLGINDSLGYQEQMDWILRPEEIGHLKKGGDGVAEAIIISSGEKFRYSSEKFLKIKIRQI